MGLAPTIVVVLSENGAENTPAVANRVQVADAVDPRMFKASNLFHYKSSLGDADINQRLDFEPVTPQSRVTIHRDNRFSVKTEHRDILTPKDIEAVA